MPVRGQAKVISPQELHTFQPTLPKSWVNAAGLLRRKKCDPVAYQRQLRQEWEERTKQPPAKPRRRPRA